MISSCSKSPSEQIVGTWKFDHMEMKNDGGNSQQMDMAIALAEVQFKGVTMQYFKDGTFETVKGENSTHGTYHFESDDKYLVTQQDNSDKEKRSEIITLNSDSLILGDKTGTIVLVRSE